MLKVNIKDQQYNLPETITEVSLQTGIIKEKIEEEYNNIPEFDNLDYKKEILGCLMNCSVGILDEVLDDQIELIYSNLYYLEDISVYFSNSFTIKGIDYNLIDLEDLTVTDYADLDAYLKRGIWENITKILAILYRPVTRPSYNILQVARRFISRFIDRAVTAGYTEYNNVLPYNSYKEYKKDYLERADIFSKYLNYPSCKAMVMNYIEYKYNLLKDFNLISTEPTEEEDESIIIRSKAKSVAERFDLYHQLQVVSNNNILELEHWKKEPIRYFFTKVYYLSELTKEYNNKIKHKK